MGEAGKWRVDNAYCRYYQKVTRITALIPTHPFPHSMDNINLIL